MNVWGDPTHHLKRQLDHCTHFRTTMQQNHTAWNTILYQRRQNVTFIEPDMWPPSSPDLNLVNYTIWVVLHFLLYAVYICQKSLNFTYAFKCYQQNCSWLHFTWTTLYILEHITINTVYCFLVITRNTVAGTIAKQFQLWSFQTCLPLRMAHNVKSCTYVHRI